MTGGHKGLHSVLYVKDVIKLPPQEIVKTVIKLESNMHVFCSSVTFIFEGFRVFVLLGFYHVCAFVFCFIFF